MSFLYFLPQNAFIAGPIVAMLCNRYGHRTVGICSGLLVCVSMVISAFAPNLMVLYFVYGLGAGTNF